MVPRPVEIIDSQVTSNATSGDLVRFVIKASYFDPEPHRPRAGAAR